LILTRLRPPTSPLFPYTTLFRSSLLAPSGELGERCRGTYTGSFERPSRPCVVPADRTPHECGGFARRTRTAIQALSSQTPGRIPWGESAPGHGKAPWVVGPWGDLRHGAYSHARTLT